MRSKIGNFGVVLFIACLIKTFSSSAQIISTVAGTGTASFGGDGGSVINAQLYYPMAVKFDATGNLYIADYHNSRVRKVDNTGIISTIAGNGTGGNTGDGGQATSAEIGVEDITFDPSGNLCIGSGMFVRLVNTAGIITSIVGSPYFGPPFSSGDGGPATDARIGETKAIIYDSSGNMYIADPYSYMNGYHNNNVRKVDLSGIITTVAGNGSVTNSGDGGYATSAGLSWPAGLAIDNTGNLYISVLSQIRKVNTSGIITTIAGTGVSSYSGDNGQAINAQLDFPQALIFDAVGNLFFADRGICNCVRKVDTAGIITTIAGNGTPGYSGDGGLATAAQLKSPYGITLDASGNLYIADLGNNRIRMVTNVAMGVNQLGSKNTGIRIFPNPATNVISLNANDIPTYQNSTITIQNTLGQPVKKLSYAKSIDVSYLIEGCYFLQITLSSGVSYKAKFVKQ